MRTLFCSCITICLLFITACQKYGCSGAGGWTLGTHSYPVCNVGTATNPVQFYGYDYTNGTGVNQFLEQSIIIYFFNSIPVVTDTLTLTKNDTSTAQATIFASINNGPPNGSMYVSTSGTVFIGVSGGKLTATGSGITTENVSDTTDIRTLSLNIHQTE